MVGAACLIGLIRMGVDIHWVLTGVPEESRRSRKINCHAHIPDSAEGVQSSLEFALTFAAWMRGRRDPDPAQLCERWNISRSTAYRWLAAWEDAKAKGLVDAP